MHLARAARLAGVVCAPRRACVAEQRAPCSRGRRRGRTSSFFDAHLLRHHRRTHAGYAGDQAARRDPSLGLHECQGSATIASSPHLRRCRSRRRSSRPARPGAARRAMEHRTVSHGRLAPATVSLPGNPCSTQLSWMLARLFDHDAAKSPRRQAHGPMYVVRRDDRRRRCSTALGCTYALGSDDRRDAVDGVDSSARPDCKLFPWHRSWFRSTRACCRSPSTARTS